MSMGPTPTHTLLIRSTGCHCAFVAEPGRRLVLGRALDCDLTIWDRSIARRHLIFRCEEEGVWLEDAGSPGGAYVNGERLSGARQLARGDEVRISSHWTLRVRDSVGSTLWECLERGHLQLALALRMAHGLARQLADLHAQGLCVGIFSPRDVWVEDHGATLLYTSLPEGSTVDPLTIGNPAYLAPEVPVDGTLRCATDVYVLGLLLFESLCGELPFHATLPQELLVEKAAGDLRVPSHWPANLRALVGRLLEVEPELRPGAEQVMTMIEELLESQGEGVARDRYELLSGGECVGVAHWGGHMRFGLDLRPTAPADWGPHIEQRFVEFMGHRDEPTSADLTSFFEQLLPAELAGFTARHLDPSA